MKLSEVLQEIIDGKRLGTKPSLFFVLCIPNESQTYIA